MSEGWKPTKGWLSDKQIPRNSAGDPAFTLLEDEDAGKPYGNLAVLSVFSPEQVTYMVNKWLYAQDYQRTVHRNRAAEERELLVPIKRRFKELFGGSFAKATEAQIAAVMESLRKTPYA